MRVNIRAILLFFAFAFAGSASPGVSVHNYPGRDRTSWKETTSSATPSPGGTAALYAGGEYNVSIAKTTVDAAGNVYIIGSQLVTVGSYTAHTVFVTKIDATGATVYITRLGGKGDDIALGIGVDAAGRVYGGGYTTSPDFPLLHPLQTEISSAGTTGFVFALDSGGSLQWSTYFGGSGRPLNGSTGSSVKAVAVDATGNTYLTGTSQLPNFAVTPGAFQTDPHFNTIPEQSSSGFVAKLTPAGQLVYATWLGGSLLDCTIDACLFVGPRIDAGTAIAVDSTGSAYVAGYSDTADFPITAGAFQTTVPPYCPLGASCPPVGHLQYYNAFLTKVKPDGSGLVYSTFLGNLGTGQSPPADGVNKSLLVDSTGSVYAAFSTTGLSITIPVTGSQSKPSGGSDVLLLELNSSGSALQASAWLGGSGDDSVSAIALDAAGDLYISGNTVSPDFPDSYGVYPAGTDFVAELAPGFGKLSFSARLPGGLAAQDIAVAGGTLITAGLSGHVMRLNGFATASFPAVLAIGNAANGTVDSAVLPNEIATIFGTGIGPPTPVTAQPTLLSNSLFAAVYPESLGGVKVSFNGQPAALLYVSSGQINLGMPYGMASPVLMTIVNNGVTLGPFAIGAASQTPIPGIFRNADGSAAVLNQDGSLNTAANPAHSGQIIAMWGTGVPGLTGGNGGEDGGGVPAQVADLTSQGLVTLHAGPSGYFSIPIVYAGGAPELPGGVFQVNAKVGAGLGFGAAPVFLQADGIDGPSVTVYVAP